MLLDNPQAQGVEGADIHLIDVCDDPSGSELICDSGDKLFCCFLCKGSQHDLLWPDALLLNEVDRALHEGEGFSRSGTRRNKNRAICGFYCPSLALIRMPKIKQDTAPIIFWFICSIQSESYKYPFSLPH